MCYKSTKYGITPMKYPHAILMKNWSHWILSGCLWSSSNGRCCADKSSWILVLPWSPFFASCSYVQTLMANYMLLLFITIIIIILNCVNDYKLPIFQWPYWITTVYARQYAKSTVLSHPENEMVGVQGLKKYPCWFTGGKRGLCQK